MAQHALLGASGSKMWLNCVGSARLNEKIPDPGSEYAAEGSLAHAIAEHFLRNGKDAGLREFSKSPYYNKEMVDHCLAYAEFVKDQPGDSLLIEQRLDYSAWVPEGFGTGDAILVSDDLLTVIDFKYGKGVKVEAEDNTQLMFYALGAIGALDMIYDFEKIKVIIFQPRLDNVTEAEYTIQEILDWAETVRGPAQRAWDGEETYKAGDWCKFCRAKATCRTRMETEAKAAFDDIMIEPEDVIGTDASQLTEDEILYWMARADGIIKFLNDLKDYAAKEAINQGRIWPGYKIVEGRSNRKYSDPVGLIKLLDESNAPSGYIKTELVGVTEMEKVLGKKLFKELVEPTLIKAPGKPTLVPETDKRPAIDSSTAAKEAFEEG